MQLFVGCMNDRQAACCVANEANVVGRIWRPKCRGSRRGGNMNAQSNVCEELVAQPPWEGNKFRCSCGGTVAELGAEIICGFKLTSARVCAIRTRS